MKILVVGATGVLGRNVIPRLVERGYHVRAIVRNQRQENFLRDMGVEPAQGDIFDKDSLHRAAAGCDLAIHIATAISTSSAQDWSVNDRVRREGTHNLLEAAKENGITRYIQQSITLLYGENGQRIVDESAPTQSTLITQSAADMEKLVCASSLDWCILRGGLFYGPGTGRETAWRESAWEGKLMLPGDGSDLVSLIHVIDMARAVVTAVERAAPKSLYNIVDDQPVSFERLFSYVADPLNVPMPQRGGPRVYPSLGCSNARAKKELGWQPAYPSYLSGLM